jgi:hypothetical protein
MPIDPNAPPPAAYDPNGRILGEVAELRRRLTIAERTQKPTVKAWSTVGADGGLTALGTKFTHGSTPVQYMRDNDGFVHLRGVALATDAGANFIFALPEGFRPGEGLHLAAYYFNFGAPSLDTITPLVIEGVNHSDVKTYGSINANDHIRLDVAPFWAEG